MNELDEIKSRIPRYINQKLYAESKILDTYEAVDIVVDTGNIYLWIRVPTTLKNIEMEYRFFGGIRFVGVDIKEKTNHWMIAKLLFWHKNSIDYSFGQLEEFIYQIISAVRLFLNTKSNLNKIDALKMEI